MSFLIYQKQNPEFLNNYLKYKRYIEFSAKTTVNEAYFDLRTLFRYIKLYLYNKKNIDNISIEEFKKITIEDVTIEDISKITQNILDNYLFFLNDVLNNSPKTRNRKLASTKRFFEYLSLNNLISYNPTQGMSGTTIEKRIPKYLDLTASKKLLSKTITSNQRYKIRNYAITCLLLNCSLRLSELTQIDLSDLKLDENEQTLKVHGKGTKERLVYLNEAVCEALTKYLEIRPPLGKENIYHNALFLSSRNKRISTRSVENIIVTELKETLEENRKGYHTHTLRHSGATLMYNENDTNIFVLKKILGHKSTATTEIYTHVSDKKLKYIMKNCTISNILEKLEKKEVESNGGK